MRPSLIARVSAQHKPKKTNMVPWEVYPLVSLLGFIPLWIGYFAYGNTWGKRENLRLTRSGESHLRLPEVEHDSKH